MSGRRDCSGPRWQQEKLVRLVGGVPACRASKLAERLNMDRVPKRLPGGFVHRFAQSRMRVNRRFNFFVSRFQRHRQTKLCSSSRNFRSS